MGKQVRKRPGVVAPGRTRKTIALPAELARRLAAYAAWHGRDEQDVVAEALTPLLAGFYVATRGPGSAADPPPAEGLRVAS